MQNGTMMQYFHWYYPANGSLWKKVKNEAPYLASIGINAVWLPPAFKGTEGKNSIGYDVYDLYDLGEFKSKGSVRTKYGTRGEYLEAIAALHQNNIQVYVDIVLNHLGGGDETEVIEVVAVNPDDRNQAITDKLKIEAYTRFTYPSRKGKYSTFQWDHTCFSGVDYDHISKANGVFNILNDYPAWEDMVTEEKGNYDYLMFSDIEFRNPAVRTEIEAWGKWYYETTRFDGMRLDAVKHITPGFYNDWLEKMRDITGQEMFTVAEFWAPGDVDSLHKYIDATNGKISLFDSALHTRFHIASRSGCHYDLSNILNDSLVSTHPQLAVTLVANHDTQPLQALEAPVDPWFKPLAYALVLLRENGYPCIFFPDLYSAEYTDKGQDGNLHHIVMPALASLPLLCKLRKLASYGVQNDYFDHNNCVAWTREGEVDVPFSGCAVVMSNGDPGNKRMYIGLQHAGKRFVDALQHEMQEIIIDESGEAEFYCPGSSLSVWVNKELVSDLQIENFLGPV